MKKVFTLITLVFLGYTRLWASCGNGFNTISLDVFSDSYPTETSWDITNGGGTILASGSFTGAAGTLMSFEYCIPDSIDCITFNIHDSYGDGICCTYGNGYYLLKINGDTLAQNGAYGYGESVQFNCPPGGGCSSAEAITAGSYTSLFDNYWYSFTPSANGMYTFSTCNQGNSCNSSSIWIYDHCQGIVLSEGIQGAVYFANSGCTSGNGALIHAALIANYTYYIRLGDGTGNPCGNSNINWTLSYKAIPKISS